MTQRHAAVIVGAVLTMLGALQLTDPATLGLPPQTAAWAGLLATLLGGLALGLPPIQKPSPEPDEAPP